MANTKTTSERIQETEYEQEKIESAIEDMRLRKKTDFSFLTNENVDTPQKETKYTLLMTACFMLDVESVDEILKRKPSINCTDKNDNNIMHWLFTHSLEKSKIEDQIESERLSIFKKIYDYVEGNCKNPKKILEKLILHTNDFPASTPLNLIIEEKFIKIGALLLEKNPEFIPRILYSIQDIDGPRHLYQTSEKEKSITRKRFLKNYLGFLETILHPKKHYLDFKINGKFNILEAASTKEDVDLVKLICKSHAVTLIHIKDALNTLEKHSVIPNTNVRHILTSKENKLAKGIEDEKPKKRKKTAKIPESNKKRKTHAHRYPKGYIEPIATKTLDSYLLAISKKTTITELQNKGLNENNINTYYESSKIFFSALSKVAELGSPQLLQDLVTLGASVEETNNREETPILAAALSGRIDNIFKLLELKSDALATDIQHRNILHKLFSINDNLEIKIDKTSNDFYESFSQLLDHLESKTIFTLLDQKDKANKKPIFYAINSNLNRVVNLLFDYNSRALDSERALRLAEKKNVAASKETVIQLQNNLKASKYFLAVAKKEMPKKSEELERANKKISHLKTEKEVLEEKINDLKQLHLKSYKKLENDLEKHNKMLVDSAFENGTRHQNLTRSIEEQKTEIHQLEFSLEEANTNIAEKDKIINTLLGEISGLKRSRDNKRSPSKGNKKSDVKPDEIQSQLYEGILSIRNESSNITYIDTNPLNKEQSNEVMNKESGYEGILKGFLPERNKFSEFGRTPEKAIVIEEEESNKKPAGEETKSVIDLTRDDTTTEFPEQGGGNVARMPRL